MRKYIVAMVVVCRVGRADARAIRSMQTYETYGLTTYTCIHTYTHIYMIIYINMRFNLHP